MIIQTLAMVAPPRGGGNSGIGNTTSGLQVGGTPILLPNQINNVLNLSGLYGGNVINLAVNLLFFAAMLLALIFIIWGGFKWMTSEGDKKKIEEARNTIIFSLIGFIVMAVGYLIVSVIGGFFQVNLFGI